MAPTHMLPAAVGLLVLAVFVQATPARMPCDAMTLPWQPGSFITDRMEVGARYMSDGSSYVTVDTTDFLAGTNYLSNQAYQFRVSTPSIHAHKLQVSAGRLLVSSGSSADSSTCLNTYPELLSKDYTWIAPGAGSGDVKLYILAGTEDKVYVTSKTFSEGLPAGYTQAPTTTFSPTTDHRATGAPTVAEATEAKQSCKRDHLWADEFPCTFSDGGYSVKWAYNDTMIYFEVSKNGGGWAGFGYGRQMVGSYATIGWCSSGNPDIQEYYLGDKNTGSVNAVSTPLHRLSCRETNGQTTIRYLRALSASTYSIDVTQSTQVIYAWGSQDSKSAHSDENQGRAKINFSTGESSKEPEEESFETAHGAIMWVAFALLLPTGILISRHAKSKLPSSWMYVHAGIQCIGMILAIAGMALALDKFDEPLENTHGKLGVALVTFFMAQALAGSLLRPEKTNPKELKRSLWEYGHKIVGAFLLIGGIANVFLGLNYHVDNEEEDMEEDDDEEKDRKTRTTLMAIWVVVLFLLAAILEYFCQCRNKKGFAFEPQENVGGLEPSVAMAEASSVVEDGESKVVDESEFGEMGSTMVIGERPQKASEI